MMERLSLWSEAIRRIMQLNQEEIAARAFALWVKRGSMGGSPDQDWLQAEHELVREQVRARRE